MAYNIINDNFEKLVAFISGQRPSNLNVLEGKFLEDFLLVTAKKISRGHGNNNSRFGAPDEIERQKIIEEIKKIFPKIVEECDNLRENDLRNILKISGKAPDPNANENELIFEFVKSNAIEDALYIIKGDNEISEYLSNTKAEPGKIYKSYNSIRYDEEKINFLFYYQKIVGR